MNRFLRDEEGFTIQELMVVLVIGSILIGGVWSLYLFTERTVGAWRRTTDLTETVSKVLSTLSQDLVESRLVTSVSDSSLSIITRTLGKSIRYRWTDSSIHRNQLFPYRPPGTTITVRVEIRERTPSGAPRLVMLTATGQNRTKTLEQSVLVAVPESDMAEYHYANVISSEQITKPRP